MSRGSSQCGPLTHVNTFSLDYLNRTNLYFVKSLYEQYDDLISDDFSKDDDLDEHLKKSFVHVISFDGEYAGIVVLDSFLMDEKGVYSARVHIMFSRKFWGDYRVIESCQELLKQWFCSEHKVYRLEAFPACRNTPAVMLARKLGFVKEGKLRGYTRVNGIPEHAYAFSMIRPDYFNQLKEL